MSDVLLYRPGLETAAKILGIIVTLSIAGAAVWWVHLRPHQELEARIERIEAAITNKD